MNYPTVYRFLARLLANSEGGQIDLYEQIVYAMLWSGGSGSARAVVIFPDGTKLAGSEKIPNGGAFVLWAVTNKTGVRHWQPFKSNRIAEAPSKPVDSGQQMIVSWRSLRNQSDGNNPTIRF